MWCFVWFLLQVWTEVLQNGSRLPEVFKAHHVCRKLPLFCAYVSIFQHHTQKSLWYNLLFLSTRRSFYSCQGLWNRHNQNKTQQNLWFDPKKVHSSQSGMLKYSGLMPFLLPPAMHSHRQSHSPGQSCWKSPLYCIPSSNWHLSVWEPVFRLSLVSSCVHWDDTEAGWTDHCWSL